MSLFFIYTWEIEKKVIIFPPFNPRRPHYGPIPPRNILMQTLLFSFLLNNIPLSSLSVLSTVARFCLSSSFSSLRIFSTRSCSPALTQPILFTLFHSLQTSRPLSLSFFSVVGALSPSFIFWWWCQVGVAGVGVAGSTSYPICVSIMRSCPLNPPLIHQPASSRHTHTHTTD